MKSYRHQHGTGRVIETLESRTLMSIAGTDLRTVSAPAPSSATLPRAVMKLEGINGMTGSAVFVDGSSSSIGTGSQIGTKYAWNFGDTGAKYNWLEGYNAAHVYDKAGTYTITLLLTNEAGKTSTVSTSVVVSADTRKTIYVDSVSGNDANTGATMTSAVKTAARAGALCTDNCKILFHRGQTFSIASTISFARQNIAIGAYGTGNRPLMLGYMGPTAVLFSFVAASTNNAVVQDLSFDGNGATSPEQTNVPNAIMARGKNLVIRNNEFLDIRTAVSASGSPHDLLIQDNIAPQVIGLRAYFFWAGGNDITILGNTVVNSTREHIIRSSDDGLSYMLVAYNNLTNMDRTSVDPSDASKTVINIRTGSYVYILRNTLNTGQISFGPTPEMPEAFTASNIVMDGNMIYNTPVRIGGNTWNLMVRNNVITLANIEQVVLASPQPTYPNRDLRDIRIINNTGINSGTSGKFLKHYGVKAVNAVTVVNNLYAAPNITPGGNFSAGIQVVGTDLSSFKQISNNIWPAPISGGAALGGVNLISPTYALPGTYKTPTTWNSLPQVGTDQFIDIPISEALAAPVNTAVRYGAVSFPGVFTDKDGKPRPSTGSWSVGAIQL